MKNARRTQVERSAATRDALVAAARVLFAEHGYREVSTETIVRAAGLTRGALYHHFADKTELFAAVFEAIEAEVIERIRTAVEAAPRLDPAAVMRLGASTWLDACAEPEIHRVALIEGPAVLGWVRWREIGERYGMGLVQGMLAHAIDTGLVPVQPVVPLAHVMLGALREAALYLALADDRPRARREVGAVIDRLIQSLATG
jgi:AcrR family transcriptional regulator